ncbi:MAG: thioredoxin [Bacteroidia bacterium]|nr:thioredoxin [Bacteroidia bacterium]
MRKLFSIATVLVAILIGSCTNGQSQNAATTLTATEFSEKIKAMPEAAVVDVRTPGEFSKGHLKDALNCDWNSDDFNRQISAVEKTKPVFVYCMSGARSAAAASKMRADGFSEVYELKGGILKWRSANLPEAAPSASTTPELTRQQFEGLINSDKTVLVDFYAEWCAPCRKMKPYLDEISKDMKGSVIVVRINVDDNKALAKELNIDALPVLQLYKNKALTWTHTGYIEKAGVVKQF